MVGSSLAIGRALCVLHVDDHVVNRRLVQDILGGYGHEAVGAASGQEALDLLDHQLFDVVLMDINMPGINGIEVVRRLRGMPGPARTTPVVALTSEVSRTVADYLALGHCQTNCTSVCSAPTAAGSSDSSDRMHRRNQGNHASATSPQSLTRPVRL